jgi:vancomycin aglycone glucosyltransferase
MQTGAWIRPDERPLSAELVAFLDAGTPPVYVDFGSMPMRASKDVTRVAIEVGVPLATPTGACAMAS